MRERQAHDDISQESRDGEGDPKHAQSNARLPDRFRWFAFLGYRLIQRNCLLRLSFRPLTAPMNRNKLAVSGLSARRQVRARSTIRSGCLERRKVTHRGHSREIAPSSKAEASGGHRTWVQTAKSSDRLSR